MTKKKALAIDEQSYLKAMDDLKYRLDLVKRLAGTWNANKILPPFDGDHLQQLLSDYTYFKNTYAEIFAQNMDKSIPGMGSAYLQQGNRAKPAKYEEPVFQRICEALRKPAMGALTEFTGTHLLDWADGEPFISSQTIQAIKDSYSAFETAENAKIVELGRKLADISNQLAEAMQGHSKAMLPDGIIMPPQATIRVIDYNIHLPGYRSQSPCKLDAISGKYSFNPFCLKYGLQPIPAPPPPAPKKNKNAVTPLRQERSGMHLQKVTSMF